MPTHLPLSWGRGKQIIMRYYTINIYKNTVKTKRLYFPLQTESTAAGGGGRGSDGAGA